MKRTIFFLSLLLGTSPLPHAQEIDGVTVGNLKMDRNGEYLVVEMDVELSRLEVEANRAVLLTPRLVNGADSADLPAVGIYGRRRYYYYVRNGASMLSGDGETSFKAAEKPERVAYHVIVPYDGWMNGAALRLSRRAATRYSPPGRACWDTSRNPSPTLPGLSTSGRRPRPSKAAR